jgi:hypothetical protein
MNSNNNKPIGRAALALAAAQQAVAAEKEEKQKLANSINLLFQFPSEDFVWIVIYDGNKLVEYGSSNRYTDLIQLLLNIDDCRVKSLALAKHDPDLNDSEKAGIQSIKKALDEVVRQLESCRFPYALAAGFKQQEEVYFQFGQLEGPKAAGLLLDKLIENVRLLLRGVGGPVSPD